MARTRKLEIEIVADASDVKGEMADAAKSVDKFGKAVSEADDDAKKMGKSLDGMGDAADTGETRIMGAKDSIEGLGSIMKGPGEQGIASYLQGWADLSGGIANFVVPALSQAKDFVMNTAGAAIKAAGQHVKAVAMQTAAWVKLGVQSLIHAAKVAAAWLIAMGPIAIVGAAVVGLVALIVLNWDKVSKFLAATWEAIKETALAAWEGIKEAVLVAVRAVVFFFQNFTLPGLILKHWNTIRSATTAAWNFVRDSVKRAVDAIVSFFAALPGRIGGALASLGSSIWAAFKAAFSFVTNLTVAAVKTYIGIYAGIGQLIFHALANVGNRMWDSFRGAFNFVGNLVRGAVTELIGFFRRIPDGLHDIFSGLAGILTRPFEVAFAAIKRLWNSTVGGFGFSVPSWIPGLGGKSFRIPEMALGGIVPGSFGSPQMVLAHAGEMILNPRQQQQAFGQQPIIVNVYLDPNDLTSQLRTKFIRVGNRNGGNIFAAS